MDSFLDELNSQDSNVSVSRVRNYSRRQKPYNSISAKYTSKNPKSSQNRECAVCKSAGRPHRGHNIMQCDYISKADKKDMIKTWRVEVESLDHEESQDPDSVEDLMEDLNLDSWLTLVWK